MEAARLLAARSEYGYTDRVDRALPEEPEAVSAQEQRYLTAQAGRTAQARQTSDWAAAVAQMQADLTALRASSHARLLTSDLRAMQRLLDRMDRRVRASLANAYGRL